MVDTFLIVSGIVLLICAILGIGFIATIADVDVAIQNATDWCESKNGRAENLQPDYNLLYCHFIMTENTCTQTDTVTTHYQESIDKVMVTDGKSMIYANGDVIILDEEVSLDEDYVGKTIVYDKKKPIFDQETKQVLHEKIYSKYKYDIPNRGWVYSEHKFTIVGTDESNDVVSDRESCKQFEHEVITLKEIRK